MTLFIFGLGNPGKEYEHTRHNAGRLAVEQFGNKEGFEDFKIQKISKALVSSGVVEGEKVVLVLPETMMNLSGKSVAAFVKSPKLAKNLLVIHDDLDLPIGTIKFVVGRGSGGHKGVESVMRAIKTKNFARIRVGISPIDKKEQVKKIVDKDKVVKHVIGAFSSSEDLLLKKALKKTLETIRLFITESVEAAMQFANTD